MTSYLVNIPQIIQLIMMEIRIWKRNCTVLYYIVLCISIVKQLYCIAIVLYSKCIEIELKLHCIELNWIELNWIELNKLKQFFKRVAYLLSLGMRAKKVYISKEALRPFSLSILQFCTNMYFELLLKRLNNSSTRILKTI